MWEKKEREKEKFSFMLRSALRTFCDLGTCRLQSSTTRSTWEGLWPSESQRTPDTENPARCITLRRWRNESPSFRGNPTRSSDFHSDRAGLEIVSSMNGRRLFGPIGRWQLVKLGRSRVTRHTWHTWPWGGREREREKEPLNGYPSCVNSSNLQNYEVRINEEVDKSY